MRCSEINDRMGAIRLTQKAVAERVGLDKQTVNNALNGRRVPLSSTVDRIADAVLEEERRLRDYLVQLHPVDGEAA